MKMGKRILSLLMTLAMLLGMLPASLASGATTPSVTWTMSEVGANGANGAMVYKLVGHLNSPTGVQMLDTWMTYDNTVIVPVTYEYADMTATNDSGDAFTVLLKKSARESFSSTINWFTNGERGTWDVVLYETTTFPTDATDADYLEFYFRIADGKTLEDFNSTTFELYNPTYHATDAQAAILLLDGSGTDARFRQYNKNETLEHTDNMTTSLTYTNSTVAPAVSTYDVTVHYKDATGGAQSAAVAVTEGASPTAAQLEAYQTGYTDGETTYAFSHWSLTAGGAAADLTDITAATALYAVYSQVVSSYTVTFDNGTATTTATVASGGSLTAEQFPTDPTKSGYVFLGWFSGVSSDTVAIGESATGQMADTTTPITADTTYTALWAPDTLLAAIWQYGESDAVYVYSTATQVQTIINLQAADSAKVKLYGNVDVGTITTNALTIASGKTLELDLNGKKLSGATNTASTQLIYVLGTLSVCSSATAKGEIEYTCGAGDCAAIYVYAKDDVKGTVSLIDNVAITVTTTSTSYMPECYYAVNGTATGVVKNSTFTANGGRAFYTGTSVPVERIENCSFSGGNLYTTPPVTINGTVGVIKDCEFSSNHAASWSGSMCVLSVGGQIGTMENCTISSSILHALGMSVQMSNPKIDQIINCTFSAASKNGIVLNKHGRIGSISGSTITGGANGIEVQNITGSSENSTQAAGIDSLNATVDGGSGYALWVYGGSDVTVTGGRFKGEAGTLCNTADGKDAGTITLPAGQAVNTTADSDGYYPLANGFVLTYMNDGAMFAQRFYATDETPTAVDTPTKAPSVSEVYTFSHWSESEGGDSVDPTTLSATTTLYAVYTSTEREKVLTVTGADTANGQYTTIDSALEAILATESKTGTIKMLKDIEQTEAIVLTAGNITLDLDGHELALSVPQYGIGLSETAKLTLRSGTEGGVFDVACSADTKPDTFASVYVFGGDATFTLESGSIPCKPKYGIYSDGGNVVIHGGTIAAGTMRAVYLQKVNAETAPSIIVTGGSLSSTGWNDALKAEGGTNVTITGGSFTGYRGIELMNAVTAVISGDPVITGTSENALYVQGTGGQVTISGGSFSGGSYGYGLGTGGSIRVTISGGRFKGGSGAIQTSAYFTYADGCVLSATPDADGFYGTVTTLAPTVETSGTTTSATVAAIPETDGEVVVNATSGTGTITKSEVTFSATAVGSIANAASLAVTTDVADVTFNNAALTKIQTAAAEVKLAVESKTKADLEAAQEAALVDPQVILDLSLMKGTESVNFDGGAATVEVPFDLPADKLPGNFAVFYIDDKGNKTQVDSTYADGIMSFTVEHFSVYTIDSTATYTMKVTTDKAHYNVGDTVTATITASAEETSTINSFGFTLDFDGTKLALVEVKPVQSGTTATNGSTLGYVVNGTGISVNSTGVAIATATFTVLAKGTDTVTLTGASMSEQGTTVSKAPTVVSTSVTLHDLQVTFTAANGTVNGGTSLTLYARYNETGLYSDAARSAEVTGVTTAAAEGYRLADSQWSDDTNTYGSFANVAALTFTESKTYTLQTVKTYVISFATPTNGTLGSSTAITVDAGTLLSVAGLPTTSPATGYAFANWKIGTEAVTLTTYTVNSDITLTAEFVPLSFAFSQTVNSNVTVSELAGVTDDKATYGTDITFKAAPIGQYVITGVSYSVGGAAGTTITANGSGVYTIPGTAILGAITLEVSTLKYHTVTFQAGTGNTMTAATAYVKDGVAGLYTDTTFVTGFTLPAPAADSGYRLAKDESGEPLWLGSNETGYTNVGIGEAVLTANLTLTAQSVKQYTVTFAAGENGALAAGADTSVTVDTGTAAGSLTMPGTTPNAGYVFDQWTPSPSTTTITANTTFTAAFKHGTYGISFPTTAGASFTPDAGITDGQVTHGTDAEFTMTVNEGYRVTAVYYQVGSGQTQELTAVGDVYTISGSLITDAISITITGVDQVQVTFAAGANGTVGGGTSVTKTVDKNYALLATDIPTTAGNPGYTFKEWQVGGTATAPVNYTVTEAVTFTAVFEDATYNVSASGVSGVPATATHGTDLTFTPTLSSGLVTGVSAKIGGTDVTVTANDNGSYTIAGSAIIGDLTLTATTLEGASLSFISRDDYKALEEDTQIVLLNTTKLGNGRYLLNNGSEFYWSAKYNAYVKIVSTSATVATLSAGLYTDTTATTDLDYTGDINGSGGVTPADGGIINDVLHEFNTSVSEKTRLELDVTGDKTVSTQDVLAVLKTYVGTEESEEPEE